MRKKFCIKLANLVLAIAAMMPFASASTNRVFAVFGNPVTCGPTSPFIAPTWQPNTLYYGVAVSQLGNAWVQNGGRFYRNESGGPGTSGNSGGPTNTTGTQVDGTVTWRAEANDNKECGDDFAHDVYPHLDGVTLILPWGNDCGGTNCALGFETSNGGCTGHGAYSYTAFDASITNGTTGYLDNPYWQAGKKVAIIMSPIQGAPATGGNTFTPCYVTSVAYAAGLPGPPAPNDISVCPAYVGLPSPNNLATGIYNINSAGVTSAQMQGGFTGMQELPATTAWEAALANAVAHYNGLSFVDFARIAPGPGGESFMECVSNWKSFLGFTNTQMRTLWETTYIQSLVNAVSAASPNFPTEVVTNCQQCVAGVNNVIDYTWADLTAQYSQVPTTKWWLGGNGLANSDITFYNAQGAAAGSGMSSDHGFIWATYPPSGKVFQTVAVTDPTGNGTGTLAVLLPFQAPLCAAGNFCTYEAFWQDLCVAWCVNYNQYATYHTVYQLALSNFRANVNPPVAGPTSVTGPWKMSGSLKIKTQ